MPLEELRALLAVVLAGLLLLLRLDAVRFGAAEYEPGPDGDTAGSVLVRVAWPLLAIGIAALIGFLLPAGRAAIGMGGEALGSAETLVLSVLGSVLGVGAVLLAAWLPHRRWPPELIPLRRMPREALDAVGTAIVDEVTFRGVLLGLLLLAGLPPIWAFLIQLLVYTLATRLGASARTLPLMAAALGLGALTGILTLATGGIAAALVAHAVTRFAALIMPEPLTPLVAGPVG